jgi:hypothetical protein
MGFIVQDIKAFSSVGLSLQNFVVSTRNNYNIYKNQGITSVRFTSYIYTTTDSYTNGSQPLFCLQKELVIPPEQLGNIIGFIYSQLKTDYTNFVDN